ncbi:MAG: nucleotidyltransferase family protein [Oceanicoccus sp.]
MPETTEPTIVALVLAAGSSRRFGSDKRVFDYYGTPLLQRSLSIPIELGLLTTLVLKSSDEPLVPSLLGDYTGHPLLTIVFAEDALLGMGHSLSAGICSILESPTRIDGTLVFLADMPLLKVKTIEEIIHHFDINKIVVPTKMTADKKLKTGHPVLFGRYWFKQLQRMTGDNGARELLKKQSQDIINVTVDDNGIFLDIDQPGEVPVTTS